MGWLRANGHEKHEEFPIAMVALDDGDVPHQERIFQSWPHSELDFSLMITNLAAWDPHVVVIEPPLVWPEGGAPFLASLKRALQAAPRHVLGSIGEYSEYSTDGNDDMPKLSAGHMVLSDVRGNLEKLPSVTQFIASPSGGLSEGALLAFTDIDLGAGIETPGDGTCRIPLIARAGDDVVAALPLAALLVFRDINPGEVVIKLGQSVSIPGHSFPIDEAGYFELRLDSLVALQKLSAGIFALSIGRRPDDEGSSEEPRGNDMESSIIEELVASDADYSKLEGLSSRLVVIGRDDKGARRFEIGQGKTISRTEVFCQAIAAMASSDRLKRSPAWVEWALAGCVFLIGMAQLRMRRWAIFKMGLCVLIAIAVASLTLHQSYHLWFPVLRPLIVLMCGTTVAFLCAENAKPSPDRQCPHLLRRREE